MRSISNYTGQGNIILRNRQLNFSNLVATITDSRIQEDTLTLIYYSEETQAAAKAAGISVQSNTGNLTFTAASTPSMTIVCDIVLLSANIVNQVATASDIDYDNSDSGLDATDVQGAIDELRQADNIMLSDGVTSVEDALDKLQIKSVIFEETTSATGRITEKFEGMEVIVLKAHCFNQSHIVIPYTYETSNIINTGFKILNSEGMSAVANTAVKLKVFYIVQ